jgi:integrase
MRTKPRKPRPDFPLFAHPNGQWAKKINGRPVYFGSWDDPAAALELYKREASDLHAGRRPSRKAGLSLGDAMNRFLSEKLKAVQAGELTEGSYHNYQRSCDGIAESISVRRLLSDIQPDELEKLRTDLGKGKKGRRNLRTWKTELTNARCLFLYCNEVLGVSLPYRRLLRDPSRKQIRTLTAKIGPRMFSREEIVNMLGAAEPQLKAMLYLGLNCGFGPTDCALLLPRHLSNGWHRMPRPKNGAERRCPLWPETLDALAIWQGERQSKLPNIFVRDSTRTWLLPRGRNEISRLMRDFLRERKLYESRRTFYSLRRTFETVAAATGQQVAIDHIMGHLDGSMASVYRQKTFDAPLLKVSNYVRDWLLGAISLD